MSIMEVAKPAQTGKIEELGNREIAIVSGGGWEGADPGYRERALKMQKLGSDLMDWGGWLPKPHVQLVGGVLYGTASLALMTMK